MPDANFAENITPADGTALRTSETVLAYNVLYNGTNVDLQRSIVSGLDSNGIGIASVGLTGQLDDTATTTVTENQWAPVRITGARGLHVNLRDAAGAALATGVQYIEDAGLGAVGTGQGTLIIGRASVAAPTSVSADSDAVGLWAARFGALNVILRDTAGAAISTTASALSDAAANPTVGGLQSFGMVYDAADVDWDRMRAVSAADAQSNEGLLAAGAMLFNGTTYDRSRSVEALSTAPNVDTGIPAVGMGPGFDRKRTTSAMAVTLNAATTVVVNGANEVMFALKGNTLVVGTGTMVFEVAADDVSPTWVTAPTVLRMPDQTAVGGTFTPATNTQFIVVTSGWRQVRLRVASALTSGTVDVLTTSSTPGSLVVLTDRQREVTYTAVYRLAEAASSLGLTFTQVANTTKQWVTIHHAATALKTVKIRRVLVWIMANSVAIDGVLELRRITTAPATGNPAITPAAQDPNDPVAEATCLALPTTPATEAAVNSPVASVGLNMGITTPPTGGSNPAPIELYNSDKYTNLQAVVIRPLTLEGWAVDLRTVGIPAMKMIVEIRFTEE